MFRKIATGFGAMCVFVGLMMMAGSAGDCDGKCMEMANSLSDMIMIAGIGLVLMISGVFFVVVGSSE